MKKLKEIVEVLSQIVPLVVGGQDGGPGSGQKGHTTAEKNYLKQSKQNIKQDQRALAEAREDHEQDKQTYLAAKKHGDPKSVATAKQDYERSKKYLSSIQQQTKGSKNEMKDAKSGLSEAANIGKGLETHRQQTSVSSSNFPVGSKVKLNSQGSTPHEVIGHIGSIVQTTGGNYHYTKLVKH